MVLSLNLFHFLSEVIRKWNRRSICEGSILAPCLRRGPPRPDDSAALRSHHRGEPGAGAPWRVHGAALLG